MTDIATGTVASTTTDRLYIVGAASQIDTYSLVEAGYQTIIADAENIDDKVAENNSIMAAYEELRGIGDSMLGALKLLKQTYGFSSQGDSVYDDLEVYMSSSEGTNVSSVVDVSVEDSADTGTYTLAVEQIATPMRVMSKSMLYKDNPLGYDGVFNLTTENGTPTNITITPDMTLDGLADAINAVKNTTNVSASVIKAGDNDHRLVIAGDVTGEELVYNSISGTNVLQSLFITDAGGPFLPSSIIQNAQDAIINLDGVQVTRSSNTMEDVLDGVSMTVYGETNPGESIKMEVDYDYSAAKEAITAFVDSYNEFRTFYDKHMKLDSSSGSVAEDAVLFSDSILEQLNFQISSVLTSSFGDNDGLVTNLAEIGIRLTDDNYLSIVDEALLNKMIVEDYDEVAELFQTQVNTNNDNLSIIKNETTLTDFNLSLSISVDGSGDINGVHVGGDFSLFEYNGSRIYGAEGTIYEGLTFAYIGDTSAVVNIDVSQGMADLLYNSVDSYADRSTGIIADVMSDIGSKNTNLEAEAKEIRNKADKFYESEVARYARMEVEVAAAETLLATIKALLGLDNDD